MRVLVLGNRLACKDFLCLLIHAEASYSRVAPAQLLPLYVLLVEVIILANKYFWGQLGHASIPWINNPMVGYKTKRRKVEDEKELHEL
jgi:hypothetical protein